VDERDELDLSSQIPLAKVARIEGIEKNAMRFDVFGGTSFEFKQPILPPSSATSQQPWCIPSPRKAEAQATYQQ
jgi:hypothetical protein